MNDLKNEFALSPSSLAAYLLTRISLDAMIAAIVIGNAAHRCRNIRNLEPKEEPMWKTVAVTLCLALAISLALVGCSATSKPVDVTVTAADFSFEPTSLEVKAGQAVNFTFVNQGTQEHEWVLFKAGETVSVPFDADDEDKIYWEIEAEPAETKTETFAAPDKPGTYDVTCGIAGHAEAGMKGTLTVK